MGYFACGESELKLQPVHPPRLLSRSSQESCGLLPAQQHRDAPHTLEKYSSCEKSLDGGFGAGRSGLPLPWRVRRNMGSGKVPWKWASIIAAGDGSCTGGAAAAPHSYGRNVPSGTRRSFLRHQRHRALQEPGRKVHTAPLLPSLPRHKSCVLSPPQTAPHSGRREAQGPTRPATSHG